MASPGHGHADDPAAIPTRGRKEGVGGDGEQWPLIQPPALVMQHLSWFT